MRIGEARDEADLVVALEQAHTRRQNLRRGFETVWWNNIALVAGDHYAAWNPNIAQFEDRDPNFSSQADGKQPRIVINHALTVGRTELSKLTKSHPIMEVIPNSDEQTDIAATKVGRAGLDYAEWKFKLRKRRKQAYWWMIQTGIGAMMICWDPLNDSAGTVDFIVDPATGEPTFNPNRINELEQMVQQGELSESDLARETYPLGDLDFRVYSPFGLFPDETATDFDEIRDLITLDVLDVDVVKGLYGRSARGLEPESNLTLTPMTNRMLSRAGVAGGAASESSTVENGVRVFTYWLPPNVYRGNKFLRNGVMMRWATGRQVLDFAKAFPYQDNRIPFVFFQHIPSTTTIWPDSIMTHIRGPNLEIDKTVSQLIANKDYMANPMWLIATQHKIKGEVKNVAGAIVRYRHVPNIPPPTPVQGLQMPAQVENIIVGLREQILDISGQSEVARGRVPSGVRSGVAVAYLQEEDDTKIGPTVENLEEAVGLMGSMVLERYSQFYTFERVLRFYRRDGIFDVRRFKGADLKNNTDVVCQAGSAMPKMKAARQQYALELAQLGLETDPRKLKEMLELGVGEPDDTDLAIAQANRENNMMMVGVWKAQTMDQGAHAQQPDEEAFKQMSAAVPVKSWHNHQVHIARHTSVMMQEEFDNLAISRPDVVRLFDEHLAMHFKEVAQQQQQQAAMLQAAKGAPDGPPTPAGGSEPGANGQGGPTAMTQMQVGDPIGGGILQNTTRSIRGQ